jgi:DNA modification methylase
MRNEILQGDSLSVLRTLPSEYVQTVVTSPPYFALRDYGIDGQIGLERTPAEFIDKLVQVFREVWRVLRADGTCWVNIGDSYAGGKRGRDDSGDNGRFGGPRIEPKDNSIPAGFKSRDLMMIPARLAIALQDDGWYLRCDIIWEKPNSLPESVQNRPTRSHEYVYLLSKQEQYFYDADAIAEKTKIGANGSSFMRGKTAHRISNQGISTYSFKPTRNRRSVWNVATTPFADAHFAVMPQELARMCILAGSQSGDVVLDPFSGAGTTAFVASRLGRNYLGIELNPQYVEMSRKRLSRLQLGLWGFSEVAS